MNRGHHGALYDQIEAGRIHQRGSVFTTVWGAFFGASRVLGGPPPCLSFFPFFFFFFFLQQFSFSSIGLLGQVPVPSALPSQLLGVVVRIEKYGHVRSKALNAIMTVFPLNAFVVLSCVSTFPAPRNDKECHYRWQVTSSILGQTVPRRALSVVEEGLFLPMTEEGFFPWAGPLAQYRHRHGPTDLLPPTIAPQNSAVRLLGRRGGFW